MKIMLISPPYHSGVVESAGVWLPLWAIYVGGAARARGHEVLILDAMSLQLDHEQIRERIREESPQVVATSAITACLPDAARLLEHAKADNPKIVTVLGNVHPTFMWRETLTEYPGVDYIACGEGDETLADLADALATDDAISSVRGLAWRDGGNPVTTATRPRLDSLDKRPTAWDLLDWSIYTYRPRPDSTLAVVSSSRGCSQQCTFCSQQQFWERSWRGRSPEDFVDELIELRDSYGVSVAMLSDETPTLDRERWERILGLLIEHEVGVELLMETRVDDILRDEDLLPRYRQAGVSHIYVGVESPDQSTLDAFNKDISVEQSRRAIELINRAGIISETSFLLGLPDETPEHIESVVDLAIHYGPDMAFFLAVTPWPYSPLYPMTQEYIETNDWSRYNLVEPVARAERMSLEEIHEALFQCAHRFFGDKFKNLDRLSPEKRDFMLRVFNILLNHSYLKDRMQGMAGEMPDWVKEKLEQLTGEEKAIIGTATGLSKPPSVA